MVKTYQELENERKEKQFFNEFKKWSFEDYKKYRDKKKNIDYWLIFFVIVLGIGTISAYFFGIFYYTSIRQIQVRDNILINEAKEQCNEINETFIGMKLMYESDSAFVGCSKHNLIIGGMEIE